jgi:hypothetical protein
MLVGTKTIFASHLPMFHNEHRYQLIMAVDLKSEQADSNALYIADRLSHPGAGMYTLEPKENFVLKRFFTGKDRRAGFPGTVYRGHVERGGQAIAGLARADVKAGRIVYAREIGGAKAPSRPVNLTYILFGDGAELFLAHQIVKAPDFDQLLSVKLAGHAFTAGELARGVIISIARRPNRAANRLTKGETIAASARIASAPALPVTLTVAAEPYFEQGELAATPTFAPTPLEIAAGFGKEGG